MPDDDQQDLFDKLMMGYPAERVIFGHENFLCPVQKIFEYRNLYGKSSFRAMWLRYLWPENPCEFFISIRNPATFIPAAMRAAATRDYAGFTKGVDPRDMRWSEVIEKIQDSNPDCPITVWCNEDTPLVWPTVLREISDADPSVTLDGEFDVLRSIMSEDGFTRMISYLEKHPRRTRSSAAGCLPRSSTSSPLRTSWKRASICQVGRLNLWMRSQISMTMTCTRSSVCLGLISSPLNSLS